MSDNGAGTIGEQLQSTALDTSAALELFVGLLGRTHLSTPADLAAAVAEQVRVAGGDDVAIYLIDYEQHDLHSVPMDATAGVSSLGWDGMHGKPGSSAPPASGAPVVDGSSVAAVSVEGTVPGRCFATTTILQSPTGTPRRRRLWIPLIDGTDRIGVLTLTVPIDDGRDVPKPVITVWERFAHLVAQLVVGKGMYGDTFERVRRTRRMTLAGELQWSLLPPQTFASPGLVVSAMLDPCYEDGGDSFDYAVNADSAHFAIIDAMGHGLVASGTAAFTLAAYREARRAGLELPAIYAAVDDALAELYGGERYATAVLAELDLSTGRFRWIGAGHPEPLLLREGRFVKTLSSPPVTPLGIPFTAGPVEVATEQLEPGDRVLLYSDGLPEARQPDGSFFGIDRLADFIERAGAAGYPAPETLRRLRHSVLQHQDGVLQDDATAVLIEWQRGSEQALLPQTVELPAG